MYKRINQRMLRYDFTHRFWRTLSNERISGGEFPLASLVLALSTLALFSMLSIIVINTHWLNDINNQTFVFFEALRNPFYDPAFIVITMLGDSTFLYLSFPIFVALLTFRGYYPAAIHITSAGIATSVITHGLKAYIAIPRPDFVINGPASYAFPSGHTSGAVVLMGLFAAFIAQEQPIKKRWMIYGLFSIPMILIGLSRLYLGVHWFSDIIGGLLLGLAICGLTRVSYSRFDKQALTIDVFTIMTLAVWLIALTLYIWNGYTDTLLNYQLKP